MTPAARARVVHMPLDAGAQALARDDRFGHALVVFWHAGMPLGQLLLHETHLPLTAAQMAEAAAYAIEPALGWRLFPAGFNPRWPDHLWRVLVRAEPAPLGAVLACDDPLDRLTHAADDAAATGEGVSVVVCTRDRADLLANCLAHIQACRPCADEIIVVDNAPRDDSTRRLVASLSGVRYIREERAGLSRARNAGIRASAGAIVAFTDDDAAVHPSWIGALRRAMRDPGVASATGLVLPAALDTEARWRFEMEFGGFGQGYRSMRFDERFVEATARWGVPVWRIGAGANMALRRSAVEEVGGYDERLGAGAAGCSEDSEMWHRLLVAGHACVYEPSAVVMHSHREDMQGLREQMRAYMRGHVAALLVQAERHALRGPLWRLLVSLPAYYLRRLVRDRSALVSGRDPTYWQELRGMLEGVVYYARNRRVPGVPSLKSRP